MRLQILRGDMRPLWRRLLRATSKWACISVGAVPSLLAYSGAQASSTGRHSQDSKTNAAQYGTASSASNASNAPKDTSSHPSKDTSGAGQGEKHTDATDGLEKELLQPGAVTFGLDVSLGSYVTTRAFQTSREALDGILAGQLGLSLIGRQWKIGYRGGLSAYLSNNQLTGQQHEFAVEKSFAPDWARGIATFQLGGGLLIEDNVDYFQAYDQIRSEARLGVSIKPTSWMRWALTSTTGYAHYFQTNEFGHVYQRLSLLGVLSLPTRTRLRWRGDWTFRYFTITPGNMAGSAHIDTDVVTSHRLRLSLALEQRFGKGVWLQLQGGLVPHINDVTRFYDGLATTRPLVAGLGSQGQELLQLDALNVISGGDASVSLRWSPLGEKRLRLSLRGQWQMRHYFGHAVTTSDGVIKDRLDHVFDVGLGLSWRLPVKVAGFWGDGLYLNANYGFRFANSNDAAYAYQQHLIYLGIGTRWH